VLVKNGDMSWMDWYRDCNPMSGIALTDLSAASPQTEAVALHGRSRGFEALRELKNLRRLQVREINEAQLEIIAGLMELRELRVFGFRGGDAGPIARLANLELLAFEWAPKVEQLDWIGACSALEFLIIGDLKRVSDFAPVRMLAGLKALAITSAATGPLQPIDSLAPLTGLSLLEELTINARVSGDDLSPLAGMRWIKRLTISNCYPVAEFARLAAHLADTHSDVFKPVHVFGGDPPSVMLIGRPVRHFALNDPRAAAAIARRTAEFERLKANFLPAHSQAPRLEGASEN
jgi:hypothetical protein